MRPIDQTKFGVPEGDCFSACIASILHLPLANVPAFCSQPGDWFEAFRVWLRSRGHYALMVNYIDERCPDGFYILGGKSPRGDFLHAVVARGNEIVHDPHPSRAGLVDRQDCMIILPIDAGEFVRRPIDWLYIFDADATLRRCTVKDQACPNRPDQWETIPWAETTLGGIDWTRDGFGIASNQGGVALGFLDEAMSRRMLIDLAVKMTGVYPRHDAIQICPHAPNAGCGCRKPSPEMIRRIIDAYAAEPERTVFVGDLETDRQAAAAAGVSFVWAWDFCGRTREDWIAYLAERAGA